MYYDKVPWTARITRRITTRLLLAIVSRHGLKTGAVIAEPGGANSCFFDAFVKTLKPKKYIVLDLNEKGLQKFRDAFGDNPVAETRVRDILADPSEMRETADLVFSVGLVEHFDPENTQKAIANHFSLAKAGGLVLITFPTPIFSYRAIRGALEMSGRWSFPDERPLEFEEVRSAVEMHGSIVHEGINRAIGLAQGVILAKKDT